MFLHGFPWTNFNEINLDWIIKIVKELQEEVKVLKTTVDDILENIGDIEEIVDIAENITEAIKEINGALEELVDTVGGIEIRTSALESSVQTIQNNIATINDSLNTVEQNVDWLVTHVNDLEDNVSGIQTDVLNLTSTVANLTSTVTTLSDELADVSEAIGDLSNLLTTDKSNLVAALNEVKLGNVWYQYTGGVYSSNTITTNIDLIRAALSQTIDAFQARIIPKFIAIRMRDTVTGNYTWVYSIQTQVDYSSPYSGIAFTGDECAYYYKASSSSALEVTTMIGGGGGAEISGSTERTVLWTNPNPRAAMGQNSIDLSDAIINYDIIEISAFKYIDSSIGTPEIITVTMQVKNIPSYTADGASFNTAILMSDLEANGSAPILYKRFINFVRNSNTALIGSCDSKLTNNTGNPITYNNALVPFLIVGIKAKPSRVVLWTNPNPSQAFAAQNITLTAAVDNFDEVAIEYYGDIGFNTMRTNYYPVDISQTSQAIMGQIEYIYIRNEAAGGLVYTRGFTLTVGNTAGNFDNCYVKNLSNTNAPTISNTDSIPYRIIGIKH